MKRSIFCGLLISVILMSCSKTPVQTTDDQTADWVGIYNGSVGATISRVLVTKVNNSTLKMELQTQISASYYTYVTLYNVHVNSGTTASVSENGSIAGYSDTYLFSGTGARSGNSLTLQGTGTSTTNSSDVKYYYFNGSK